MEDNSNQVVRIFYENWKGEKSVRTIRPIGIYWDSTEWHPEEQWILLAYDLDKKDYRHFAMNDVIVWGFPDLLDDYICNAHDCLPEGGKWGINFIP